MEAPRRTRKIKSPASKSLKLFDDTGYNFVPKYKHLKKRNLPEKNRMISERCLKFILSTF